MSKTSACIITPRAAARGQYHWSWHSADGTEASRCHFRYFHDCVVDARAHGYEVDIAAVVRELKAGGRKDTGQLADTLKAA